jgi:hypothetical protein
VLRKTITVATIVILSVGILSGLLILIDSFGNSHYISKQKAVEIAMQRSLCTVNNTIGFSKLGIHLLHLKNGTLFAVDERTMQDMSLATAYKFKKNESGYVWEVSWECYFSISNEQGSQINFVDAVTGKLF